VLTFKDFGFKGLISKILSFKGLSFKGLSFKGPSFKGLSLKGIRLRFRYKGFKNLLLYLNTSLYKIEHEFCPIEDLFEIVTTTKTFLDILECITNYLPECLEMIKH